MKYTVYMRPLIGISVNADSPLHAAQAARDGVLLDSSNFPDCIESLGFMPQYHWVVENDMEQVVARGRDRDLR